MPARATTRDMLSFFLPMIFTAGMLQISNSVANAVLARMPNPETSLAAYAVAYGVFGLLGSPVWSAQFVTLSYGRDKVSLHRLLSYKLRIVAVLWLVGGCIGFTSLGTWLFGTVFGASEAVVAQARVTLLVFLLGLPSGALRGVGYGLVMLNRRTVLVTFGTVVRLITMSLVLVVLTRFSTQAVVGAIALTAAMSVEGVYCVIVSRAFYQHLPQGERAPGFLEMWRFDWPLMVSQTSENSVPTIINFFLGRLANADLALASFGVLWGVVLVLMNPMRNLVQVVQTLVHSPEELREIRRFTFRICLVFALLGFGFFWLPTGEWFLRHVMGLNDTLLGATLPAFRLCFVLAFLWGYSSLARGILSRLRRTGFIAYGSMARMVTCALIGSLSIVYPGFSGAMLGILGWAGAQGAETVILSLRVRHLQRQAPFFKSEAPLGSTLRTQPGG